MERAGYQVFKFISENFKQKRQSAIVLCGPGNNGGDGFVVAKYLKKKGYKIKVYTLVEKNSYTGDALRALKNFKGVVKNFDYFKIKKNTLIIDALFGIGLKRSIKPKLTKIFKLVNKSKNAVISIDIPSGVSSDTGKILGNAIKADFTVTFHRKKIGHILSPGKEFSGKLKVVSRFSYLRITPSAVVTSANSIISFLITSALVSFSKTKSFTFSINVFSSLIFLLFIYIS